MRRLLSGLASASLVFVVAACNRAATPTSVGSEADVAVISTADQGPVRDERAPTEPAYRAAEFRIGEPLRQGNLTIFPVISKSARMEDRFITLEEGLKAGSVEVREVVATAPNAGSARGGGIQIVAGASVDHESIDSSPGAEKSTDDDWDTLGTPDFVSGEVNRVSVVNRSDKPLYLMPGEVIVGGLQDRTIAEETIIPATGEPVGIDVYCVEQGRWGQRQNAAALMIGGMVGESEDAATALAAKGERGEFFAVPGFLNKSGRVAAQELAGQSAVWNQVAKANSDSRVHSESSAYTEQFVNDRVGKTIEEYVEVLAGVVARQERVVGVVVAINGKVESAEVFESTPLFLKLWPRLLRSFALDASHQANAEDSDKAAPAEDAKGFLASILEEQQPLADGKERGLIVSKRETKERISFSVLDASAPVITGGSPVHAAGFSK